MSRGKRFFSRVEVSETLHKADRKRGHTTNHRVWGESTGRRLHNFRRVHQFLLNNFSKTKLRGMKITHLGAGNGAYMDFVAKKLGMNGVLITHPNKLWDYFER